MIRCLCAAKACKPQTGHALMYFTEALNDKDTFKSVWQSSTLCSFREVAAFIQSQETLDKT